MPRLFFLLLVLVSASLAAAQTNVTQPGFYSYRVPAGYAQKKSDRVDFVFSRIDKGNLSVLMINTVKTTAKNNKEMLNRLKADLEDQEPGQPHITIHSISTFDVGKKQLISMLVSSMKNGTQIYQRQVVALHKGHTVTFLTSYGENYKAQDKAFLASLTKIKFL
jgi:hypothetical protein